MYPARARISPGEKCVPWFFCFSQPRPHLLSPQHGHDDNDGDAGPRTEIRVAAGHVGDEIGIPGRVDSVFDYFGGFERVAGCESGDLQRFDVDDSCGPCGELILGEIGRSTTRSSFTDRD